MSYYNTTGEVNPALSEYQDQNKIQEDQIVQYFKEKGQELTPSQVWLHHLLTTGQMEGDKIDLHHTPLTSIRRAITDLTKYGVLRKTGKKVKSLFSRSEHLWELNTENYAG